MRRRSPRLLSVIAAIILTPALLLSVQGCSRHHSDKPSDETVSGSHTEPYYGFLGEISYDSSISAMVLEPMAGEHEPGIQYRSVTDLTGLVASGETDIILYFYTSLSSDVYGVTAGTEDLAQVLDGQILIVAIDAMEHQSLCEDLGVSALPEYVLIQDGAAVALFEGYNYEYWTMDDVAEWVESYGYTIDYDLL